MIASSYIVLLSFGDIMKKLLQALAFSVLGLAASAAAAEDYPNNTVRWVVPYTAGGGSDVATRVIADHISAKLGVPFVVENKPGAATIVAAQDVARAKPDTYSYAYVWHEIGS